ncbi:sugar phosphate isomerase/epimerase family protein [Spirochaeta isovalerica]|uniref:Sugar phosphate isomerase/epimerase n=1 Tax=Spirochaeta isovalerica TaxID=150 RepID=A0A841RA87_9SPIO|nr:TIM barrel protein [Spirochaeta isovalerica]MBB6479608.1 sugar phosphate isomerase/epimerase [Spirochaeta isovalerica]
MIGVSPAYYISRYGTAFTIDDVIEGMDWLRDHHFTALQLEVFHYNQIDQWTFSNGMRLKNALDDKGLKASQFVAHFLMNSFDSPESLRSDKGLYELEFISALVSRFSLTGIITVPIPPFESDGPAGRDEFLYFDEKLNRIALFLEEKGLALALEPQPGSLAADLSFLERHGKIGLNLDPGHLLCSGIDPFSLDLEILSRVMATHLCENDGVENLSLRPGTFDNRWASLLGNLIGSGYRGTFDLEIICRSEQFEPEYEAGRFFLENYCIQNNIYI